MRILTTTLLSLLFTVRLLAEGSSPKILTVTPDHGKPSVSFTAGGSQLTTAAVKHLYLTNGKDDIKVDIVTQKDSSIIFKVPATTRPGRYALMILTADAQSFIEQPVKLLIEE